MNRLCDKCSYQNDCYDESKCKFLSDEAAPAEGEDESRGLNNFEYLKALSFNDMVDLIAAGLGVAEEDVAVWLAQDST